MKIFIIGGAGYIGSHMVKIAHKAGHDVVTVDNLSTGHQDAVLFGEFELCDILDAAKLGKLFKKTQARSSCCGNASTNTE